MTRKVIDLLDFSLDEIREILRDATEIQGRSDLDDLRNKVVGLLFLNPSLRTLASMQTAVAHLGGTSVVIQPGVGSWKLETRDGVTMDGVEVEHIREAIPVLSEYFDLLGVRCFSDGKSIEADFADSTIHQMASLTNVPFVNLESASSHPCQSFADWKTLDDLGVPSSNGKFVLSWAYHPKPLPYAVPSSALNMALLRGMNVTVLRPEGYGLPGQMRSRAEAAARLGGGTWRETDDRTEAMEGAHVLYCKSWAMPSAYGAPEVEAERRSELRSWMVDEDWFGPAEDSARFMHCLPVRRNVKVSDAVLDGPRSVVIQQAGNRLHVQKALLRMLVRGEL